MSDQPSLDGLSPEDLRYLKDQAALIRIARELAEMDLDTFLNRAARANAIGPISDPSLFRTAGATMGSIEDLARAAADFKLRLRTRGVLAQLAIEAHAQQRQGGASAPARGRGPYGAHRG